MTSIPKISALFETSLASSLSDAGSSFTVVSGTDRDGNALSGLYGFIIDEGSADEEFVVGTISGTTVTITKRGCDADAPETEVTDNKKAHRRGASVKITDYPIMAYLRNALAGESGYELPTFLKMASTVGSPTDDKHLATKEYVDDSVSAGSGIPNKIIVAGNAGETISAAGKLIYFDDTDNEWKLCDADTAATVENTFLGISQGAGVDGGAIANGVLLFGVDPNQSGLTIGAPYYASNTAGAISASVGTKEVTVGFGKSATELYFCPRFNQQLTEDQQDALAGSEGTPSASNKFLTEDDAATTSTASDLVRANSSGKIDDSWLENQFVMGPLNNAVAKLYFNAHLLFTLWTGSTNGAATTDFVNWERTDSTKVVIPPLGTMASFASTGDASLKLTDPFYSSGSTVLNYSNNHVVILDFNMKYISGTGEAQMGFFGGPEGVFGDNATGAGFHIANGVLYALTQKADPNGAEVRTDISSGLTLTNWNNYRIEFDMGADTVRFYVNGVLKRTSTGAGGAGDSIPVAGSVIIGFGRDTTNPVLFNVTAPYFSVELNP